MKKVCIITANRSEYGILRWLIHEVANDDSLTLQLVVTGAHLSTEFGLTYREIEQDGFEIVEKVDLSLTTSTKEDIVKAMGTCSIGFSRVFSKLNPDIVVVLGDRYELLAICGAALMMNVPIAHISGGDVTEGALDDQLRNAITMMASIHFPGVKESADRIKRMIGSSKHIYTVGEPGLDNFNRLSLWNRQTLADNLCLDSSKNWILLTYHSETKLGLNENLKAVNNIIAALDYQNNIQVIITGSNSDYGGTQINNLFEIVALKNSSKYKFFMNLGQLRYLSIMKEVSFLIGNSSSGIFEAPYVQKPVINIGNRQKGRYLCDNVISSETDLNSIMHAITKIKIINSSEKNYYGYGNSTNLILNKIKMFLK